MRRLYIILAAIAVAVFLAYSAIFIVNGREQAIVLRFGEIDRVLKEPGIYFKFPTNLVETVQIIDDRILSFGIEDLRVQVNDGRRYLVDAFVAYHIVSPQAFVRNVSGSLTRAQENLRTRFDAALRRVYGQRSFEAALSEERSQMMREVRDQLRPLAADLGIDIVDVRIRRTNLLSEVSQQTFERMKAERLAEAAELRARGTEEALRIRAEADRQAVVTVAEATRDAQIARGQGEAERSRIYAQAYQQDPEFFAFYRSMNAYERAIDGDTTTLVLTPDSEFFRFFNDSTGPGDAETDQSATGDLGVGPRPSAPAENRQPQVLAPAAPPLVAGDGLADANGGGTTAIDREGAGPVLEEGTPAVQ